MKKRSARLDSILLSKSPEPEPLAPVEFVRIKTDFDNVGVCFICSATSCGEGIGGDQRNDPIRFFCDHCGITQARRFQRMRRGKINEFESLAATAAGSEAGQLLDSIGETDLLRLTPDQYARFCQCLIANYIKHLRKLTIYEIPED
jgi:hypothetical protein